MWSVEPAGKTIPPVVVSLDRMGWVVALSTCCRVVASSATIGIVAVAAGAATIGLWCQSCVVGLSGGHGRRWRWHGVGLGGGCRWWWWHVDRSCRHVVDERRCCWLGVMEVWRWLWWVHGDTGWMRWKLNVGGDFGGGALGVVDELTEGGDFL